MGKENEEQEKIDRTQDADTQKQEEAMAETFGYDGGGQEDEGGESDEESTRDEEEQEESSGEESEQGGEEDESSESDEEVSDELDDILEEHEGVEVDTGDEEEEEDTSDEDEGEEEEGEEEESEAYEPMDLDLDNDEFEDVTSSPEAFSDFIKSVREDAVKEAQHNMQEQFQEALDKRSAEIEENILQNIPEVVDQSHNRAQRVSNVKDQFFSDYPDLNNKKGYVRNMTALVSNEHPDWSAKQVLNEVGKRAERDLDITKQAEEREQQRSSNNDDNPKFAGAGGRQSPGGGADDRGKQQKLMDETFG